MWRLKAEEGVGLSGESEECGHGQWQREPAKRGIWVGTRQMGVYGWGVVEGGRCSRCAADEVSPQSLTTCAGCNGCSDN
jgi:hypothetical protein